MDLRSKQSRVDEVYSGKIICSCSTTKHSELKFAKQSMVWCCMHSACLKDRVHALWPFSIYNSCSGPAVVYWVLHPASLFTPVLAMHCPLQDMVALAITLMEEIRTIGVFHRRSLSSCNITLMEGRQCPCTWEAYSKAVASWIWHLYQSPMTEFQG